MASNAFRGNDGKEGQQIIYLPRSDEGNFAKFKDALFIAAVLGLVGTVWSMSINVAKLETTVGTLAFQVRQLEARLKP